jgi:large subunit ribosomal protein L33
MHGKNIVVRMVSTEDTGSFYMTTKNPSNHPDKLELKKYCKYKRRHVLYREASSAKGKKKKGG